MGQVIQGVSDGLWEPEDGVESDEDGRRAGEKRKRKEWVYIDADGAKKRTKRVTGQDERGAARSSAIARGRKPLREGEDIKKVFFNLDDINSNEDEDDDGKLKELHEQAYQGRKGRRGARIQSTGLDMEGMYPGSDQRENADAPKQKNARQAGDRKGKSAESDAEAGQGRDTVRVKKQRMSGTRASTSREKPSGADKQDDDDELQFISTRRIDAGRSKSALERLQHEKH